MVNAVAVFWGDLIRNDAYSDGLLIRISEKCLQMFAGDDDPRATPELMFLHGNIVL